MGHVWKRGDIAYFDHTDVPAKYRKMLDYTPDTYVAGIVHGFDGSNLLVTCNQRKYASMVVSLTVPLKAVITEDDQRSASVVAHIRAYAPKGEKIVLLDGVKDPVTGRFVFEPGATVRGTPVEDWGIPGWMVPHLPTLNVWRVDAVSVRPVQPRESTT